MKKKRWIWIAFLLLFLSVPKPIQAEEATIDTGSEEYTNENGSTFPIGVYLRSDATIGDYQFAIQYDPATLRYVSGADAVDEASGILYFSGEGNETQIKYWLTMECIAEGDSSLQVISAQANHRSETDNPEVQETEALQFTNLGTASVHVVPEGSLEEETEETLDEPEGNPDETEDNPDGEPDETEGDPDGTGNGPGEAGGGVDEDEANLDGAGEDTGVPGDGLGENGAKPDGANSENEKDMDIASAVQTGENPVDTEEHSESGNAADKKVSSIFFNMYVLIAILLVGIVLLVNGIVFLTKRILRKSNTDRARPEQPKEDLLPMVNLDDYAEEIRLEQHMDEKAQLHENRMQSEFGTPIIQIDDVTMEFHLSSSNPSGIKDYLIQVLKRQVTYRKLFALYHVSFNVYKGEIVGIIGTNGSGKSTLLKIVSGALRPSQGKVVVDTRKVQLLTLGTGFDMELTARENVYLNGSIIGYSKEFLDRHYDEIVRFAELEDFMEEKVKNFSSGMVSRLGFAIATVADAAEILILDEVLSVGDEFFRKKSLQRIKEMIHGGSTVLLVSHSMGTILEHCTKVVWIEKGKLQMVGEPKVVCEAYRKMNKS